MRLSPCGLAGALILGLVSTHPVIGAGTAPQAKKRLLVVTASRGFRHGCVTRGVSEPSADSPAPRSRARSRCET
jgi:hypothetical protein